MNQIFVCAILLIAITTDDIWAVQKEQRLATARFCDSSTYLDAYFWETLDIWHLQFTLDSHITGEKSAAISNFLILWSFWRMMIPGGVTAAKGFNAAGIFGGLRAKGDKADLALITCDVNATVAGLFTTNVVAAAPVIYCKNILKSANTARAILINAGQANAATGDAGYQDVIECAQSVSQLLQLRPEAVLILSTGVIGQRIRKEALLNSLPSLVSSVSPSIEGADSAAVAITTTDLVSKSISIEAEVGGVRLKVGGMAKGSGMIHPNMATMLSVDGDTSTNDSIIALASGLAGVNKISSLLSTEALQLQACLDVVMEGLAKSIAWDGEGATCLLEVIVSGANNEAEAARIARTVASSSLVKAAVYGRDPNWGRIACAVGYAGIEFDPSELHISLGHIRLMHNGQPLPFDRVAASNYLKQAGDSHGTVEINVSVAQEEGEAAMLCIFAAAFLLLMVILEVAAAPSTVRGFVYNGFLDSDLLLHGAAGIESNGLLRLTNATKQELGHAFHPIPFRFLDSFSGQPLSFSTSFVFAIVSQYGETSSEGFAFAISPTVNLPGVLPSQFLGLFNVTSNGEAGCHILAVELDTVENKEFSDINDNHVGIDVNDLRSLLAAPASFVVNSSGSELTIHNLSLISGNPMRIWAEYDATTMRFDVTLAPVEVPKPRFPLVSSVINLSSVFLSEMYVGFSASTGAIPASHNILGWSFSMNGREADLVISDLPTLQTVENGRKRSYTGLIHILVLVSLTLVVALAFVLLWLVLKKWRKSVGVSEEWETEYGPHRFSYSSLSKATKGFSDDNLLGSGGFGEVFKGQLPRSKQLVAVKRISHDSRQGKKEFVAEISSIGRLRHKNLVQLLGYSRRRGKLLLVYDFMPNGSLDEYIFCRPKDPLSWDQRFRIIKGIASGLLYLHEEWQQVVLHRDIKASNVLLDAEYNGKLGDFGLARLHDRGSNALTTRIVGHVGLSRTGAVEDRQVDN
ncbi:hypothetical protein HPP92_001310 [Vanilla planifolia]|uniref:Arginine biosynthesis bifunctional protein ArgJ, chloroplastic n=1 Tax=Vanilla planifolia TaxID=51239 RepID=A0A835S2A0_VANPL|nr:hypothetical protein HPP92_001310 [Vanilla planifolia]